ncbi:DUF3558 domain-containing protein [Amycolatopsis sp. FBCC-B4732]|uniref:DUF3558 domain-containing protein n=1 Tax=Amycolatopsis sp. FBCC-B4732 TaxID=3079339 RepID=UPI001FF6E3D6|nr:DUF3558 domain-containing protein [Amycolatopsis sp. FBCC-B4732]UOX89961.1 DUF3558 domain-containing protein [Amycolatopsis sp. FBCC-B4732]
MRLLGVPVALVVLAGCAQTSPRTEIGHTTSTPASSTPPVAWTGLAAMDPCTLLSPQDRSSAGVSVLGKPKEIAGARACDWTVPGAFGVTVTLSETDGLADLEVAKKTATKTTVGSHPALKVMDKKAADGTCAVLLGVGDAASVQIDVSNTGFSDTPLACRRAGTVAGLVEPKLP